MNRKTRTTVEEGSLDAESAKSSRKEIITFSGAIKSFC